MNDLYRWIFEGYLPEKFAVTADSRWQVSQDYTYMLETRMTIYEQIQELHRLEENVTVLIDDKSEVIHAIDLVDLPRLKVSVYHTAFNILVILTQ